MNRNVIPSILSTFDYFVLIFLFFPLYFFFISMFLNLIKLKSALTFFHTSLHVYINVSNVIWRFMIELFSTVIDGYAKLIYSFREYSMILNDRHLNQMPTTAEFDFWTKPKLREVAI